MMQFDFAPDHYPLEERIGVPELLVGRDSEFRDYHKWILGIPKKISKSRVIIARKKSGKTAFIQRLFNQIWSANGTVIPFYLEIPERKMWFQDFAIEYFRSFATQYISFLEREPLLMGEKMGLDEIAAYGKSHSIPSLFKDADRIPKYQDKGSNDSLWELAFTAPHRYAKLYGKSVLVMLDEFQNLNGFIYRDEGCTSNLDETIPGSFHEVSESKIAPMLITGSNVQWLLQVVHQYFQMGRLQRVKFSAFLKEHEGLEAVYRLAEFHEEAMSNEIAMIINQTCTSDPFFISSIIRSTYEHKDLSTVKGVEALVDHEVGTPYGEIAQEWYAYFEKTLSRINEHHAKNMLLFLCKHSDQSWTAQDLKEKLNLDLEVQNIQQKLENLRQAELIQGSIVANHYQGLEDSTFHLALQVRLKSEIDQFDPMLIENMGTRLAQMKSKNKSLQGALNHSVGALAEYQLAFELRNRGQFPLKAYFEGIEEGELEFKTDSMERRFFIQSGDHPKRELDIRGKGTVLIDQQTQARTLLIEVKKLKTPVSLKTVQEFLEKVHFYHEVYPQEVLIPAFLSLGGFTTDALDFCQKQHIGIANQIHYQQTEWSD